MGRATRRSVRRGKHLTVAAAQVITGKDLSNSTNLVLEMIDNAAKAEVDIVGFPEGALFGYTGDARFWRTVAPEAFAAAERRIGRRCARRRIAAVVGSAHRVDGKWLNSLAIFDKKGQVKARYGKTFLAGERWCTNNRAALPVVELAGTKCCFIICHDVRYPELVRLPAIAGAQLCWFCSCESGLSAEHKLSAYRAMPIARATENGIFLVMCNTPADSRNLQRRGTSHGNSKIVDPDGNVLAEAGYFENGLVTAKIDLSKADRQIARRSVNDPTIIGDWLRRAAADFIEHVR
ncbi:MAG TPA: carbon-nitrogen hydrolase family protein [Phycisphaerae bacterium]|nr:carbon-nitrogen hydrolase family protein [Phycisphaerae bacterium]